MWHRDAGPDGSRAGAGWSLRVDRPALVGAGRGEGTQPNGRRGGEPSPVGDGMTTCLRADKQDTVILRCGFTLLIQHCSRKDREGRSQAWLSINLG